MPHISEFKSSNYLAQADCAQGPILGTIKSVTKETVGKGAEAEEKMVIYFSNIEKPMTVNWTNIQLIAQITGSEDTDDWAGKAIVIYKDPNVSMGGKITGGLRVRAPKKPAAVPATTAPKPAPRPAPAPEYQGGPEEDDVPF